MKAITLIPLLSLLRAEQAAEDILQGAEQASEKAAASAESLLAEMPEASPPKAPKLHEPAPKLKVVEKAPIKPKQACYSKLERLDTPQEATTQRQLLIFVSSSLPKKTLQALSADAIRLVGAKLIFRGLINNSFKDTQAYFNETKINAEIDPTQFEAYHVTTVPTFILTDGKATDRLQGHISTDEALSHLKDKGDLKALAQKMLQNLRRAS